MSEAVRELPDIERIILRYLTTVTDLWDAGMKQIAGPQPPNRERYPMVYIHRSGGPSDFPAWLDSPRIQVDVWGQKDTEQLRVIFAKVRAALHRMPQVHADGVAKVTGETAGPVFFPGTGTTHPRYFLEVALRAHPRPDAVLPPVSLTLSEDGSTVADLRLEIDISEDGDYVATLGD